MTCNELKKFNTSNTSNPTSCSKEGVPYRAAIAPHLTSNESNKDLALTVSSSPSQLVLSLPRPLHKVHAKYTTHEGLNFYTGPSFHITADSSQLQKPNYSHVALMVDSGRVMYATY